MNIPSIPGSLKDRVNGKAGNYIECVVSGIHHCVDGPEVILTEYES